MTTDTITLLQRTSLDLVSRAKAWTELDDGELKRAATKAANERDAQTLWSLTEAFILVHGPAGANVSEQTLKTYKRGVLDLLEAWQGENLLRPRRDSGVMYVRGLEAQKKSSSTVRVKLAAAQALYKALRWSGATSAAPFIDAKPARDLSNPWDKRKPYSPSDMRKLLEIASDVDLVLLLLGEHAGLRVSEMCKLKWSDFDKSHGTLEFVGKGNKSATVTVSKSLHEALVALEGNEAYRLQNPDYIMPFRNRHTGKKRMANLCRRAKITRRGVHALRHTAGTKMRTEGADIADIADHLRHSDLNTARGYAKVVDSKSRKMVSEW
jgi:integrase